MGYKTLLSYLLLSFFFTVQTSGYWYENVSGPSFNSTSGARNCTTDGDASDPVSAANNNSTSSLTPETVVYAMPTSGTIRCLSWDDTLPTATSISYTNGWTNASNINVSVSMNDTGRSGIQRYQIQYQQSNDNPNFTTWGGWGNTVTHNVSGYPLSFSNSHSYPVSNNTAYRFRFRVQDRAYNMYSAATWSSWNEGPIVMIDRTTPVLADLVRITDENLLANPSQTFEILANNASGSPIDYIRGRLRGNSYTNVSGNTWSHTEDTTNVDLDIITAGANRGSDRDYIDIRRICDQAGNCTADYPAISTCVDQNFCFYTYANTSLPIAITSNTLGTELGTPFIANGSIKNVQISMEDSYGNNIVEAPYISRDVDFNINTNNSLYLNQYNRNGGSGIFFPDVLTQLSLGNSMTTAYNNRQSSTGDYYLPFYVFSPTNLGSSLVEGEASINNITYDINGSLGPVNSTLIPSSSVDIEAQPLYEMTLNGDIRTSGFIEGTNQNLRVDMSKSDSTSTSGEDFYLEFGRVPSSGNNISNPDYNLLVSGTQLAEGFQTPHTNGTRISGYVPTANRSSFLLQTQPVASIEDTYLASVVSYENNSKRVTYPFDIIGKASYHSGSSINNATQGGLKVIGNASSQNTSEIVNEQFDDDVRILGKLSKSSFRNDIVQKIFNIIRNIDVKSSSMLTLNANDFDSDTWDDARFSGLSPHTHAGRSIFGAKVLYFTNIGSNDLIIPDLSTIRYDGSKTIVVEKGDIYITGDIIGFDSNAMLGIIALDGNILIDPSVTNIEAVLFTTKSIHSFDGTDILGGANNDASVLANQLFIKGSVFSENTIGGSRSNPLQCPYFVNSNCSNFNNQTHRQTAQIYDLNFLRRYFLYDSNSNGSIDSGDSPANSGNSASGVSWPNTQYPVIIEYDPQLQTSPPPFFE